MARILNFKDFMNESNSRFCDDCSLPIIDSDFKNDFEREASEEYGGLCRKCLIERDPFIEDVENFIPHEIDDMGYSEGLEYLLNDDAVAKGEEILRNAIKLPPTESNMLASYREISRWGCDYSLFVEGDIRFKVTMLSMYNEVKPSSWNQNPNPNLSDKFKTMVDLYEKYLDHYREFLPSAGNPNSKSIQNKMDRIDVENEIKKSLTDEEWESIISSVENVGKMTSSAFSKDETDYQPQVKKEEDLSPLEIDALIDQALDDRNFKEVERLSDLKEEILDKISKRRR